MPMKPQDRMNAAKVAMMDKKAQKMMKAGREEATQATNVGASQTTMDEKTGNNAKTMTNKIKNFKA